MREHTQIGLRAARQAGRKGGRPAAASDAQIAAARMLIENGSTQAKAAATVGISLRTLTRRLKCRESNVRLSQRLRPRCCEILHRPLRYELSSNCPSACQRSRLPERIRNRSLSIRAFGSR
ncbi:hypothetical protein ALI44B_00925 [Leifsonia sp. ALI-44-B]|nr:hypothetical protein ALI44B_00925 [Leifsonia sp. ALI-44-B]